MHKNNLAGRKSFGVIDEPLARRVRAELKLFDIAPDTLGRFVGIKSYLAIRSRLAQKTGGDSGLAYPTKKIECWGFSINRRARTLESVFDIIIPLEST